MNKIKLFAGVPSEIGESGTFFRIFSASAELEVKFKSNDWVLDTPLLAGIGLNFEKRKVPFTSISFISPIDQTIEYFAGFDIADDDRLSGSSSVTVNSTASSSNTPAIQILNDTVNATAVLGFSENRAEALIQLSDSCFVDSVADGVLLNGSIKWKNRGALNLIPVNAGTKVRILEELG